LLDNLPGRYVAPAEVNYGEARITVELREPQEAALQIPEVTAA
jgi:hypothetical protein